MPHPLSQFLPDSFDPRRPVALIAGQGRYPALVAECIRAAGVPLRLVAMDEETAPEFQATFAESDRALIKVGQIGALLYETDVHLCVPHDRTMRIQEIHILLLHAVCDGIDALLLGDTL